MLGRAAAHKLGAGPNLEPPLFDYSKATIKKANIFGEQIFLVKKYMCFINIFGGPNLEPLLFHYSKATTQKVYISRLLKRGFCFTKPPL